jgi:hypothetical protein
MMKRTFAVTLGLFFAFCVQQCAVPVSPQAAALSAHVMKKQQDALRVLEQLVRNTTTRSSQPCAIEQLYYCLKYNKSVDLALARAAMQELDARIQSCDPKSAFSAQSVFDQKMAENQHDVPVTRAPRHPTEQNLTGATSSLPSMSQMVVSAVRDALVTFSTSAAFGTVTVNGQLVIDKSLTGVLKANAGVVYAGQVETGNIATSAVTYDKLAGSIPDTKLDTISTAGKVSNSATTATSLNVVDTIVARDSSKAFTAQTIVLGADPAPTDLSSAATVNFVMQRVQGLVAHSACRVYGSTNIATLSGLQTIDTITLAAGNRILLNGQTNPVQNGIYYVVDDPPTYTWSRPSDFYTGDEAGQAYVSVTSGQTYWGTGWVCSTPTARIGAGEISFVQFSGLAKEFISYVAGASGVGEIYKDKVSNTFYFRKIKAGSNIVVSQDDSDVIIATTDAVSVAGPLTVTTGGAAITGATTVNTTGAATTKINSDDSTGNVTIGSSGNNYVGIGGAADATHMLKVTGDTLITGAATVDGNFTTQGLLVSPNGATISATGANKIILTGTTEINKTGTSSTQIGLSGSNTVGIGGPANTAMLKVTGTTESTGALTVDTGGLTVTLGGANITGTTAVAGVTTITGATTIKSDTGLSVQNTAGTTTPFQVVGSTGVTTMSGETIVKSDMGFKVQDSAGTTDQLVVVGSTGATTIAGATTIKNNTGLSVQTTGGVEKFSVSGETGATTISGDGVLTVSSGGASITGATDIEGATTINTTSTGADTTIGNLSGGNVIIVAKNNNVNKVDINVDSTAATNINTGTTDGPVNIGNSATPTVITILGNTNINATGTRNTVIGSSGNNQVSVGGSAHGTDMLTVNGSTYGSGALTVNSGGVTVTAGGLTVSADGANITGTTNINTTGSAATNIGSGINTGAVTIGNSTGNNVTITAKSNVLNKVDINVASAAATNINTGTSTGAVAIGSVSGATPTSLTVLGDTTINTTGTSNTLIGLAGSNQVGVGGAVSSGSDVLKVTGTTELTDKLTVDSNGITVTAGGLTVVADGASITGATTITGAATIKGNTGLTVQDSTPTTTFSVVGSTGATTISGAGGLTISSGGASITGTTGITGTTDIEGATTINGSTAATTTIGNATNGDNIALAGAAGKKVDINVTSNSASTNINTSTNSGTVTIGNSSAPATVTILGNANINATGVHNTIIGLSGSNQVSVGGSAHGTDMLTVNGTTYGTGALTVNSGGITITAGGLTVSADGANVTGTTNINTTGSAATNIGSGVNTGVVTIGNSAGNNVTIIAKDSASNKIDLNASSAAATNINTGTSTGAVAIGSVSGATPTTVTVLGATTINTTGSSNTLVGLSGSNQVGVGGAVAGSNMVTVTGTTELTDKLTVDSNGVTVTAGGLTVAADGANITGPMAVTGATTITGATVIKSDTGLSVQTTAGSEKFTVTGSSGATTISGAGALTVSSGGASITGATDIEGATTINTTSSNVATTLGNTSGGNITLVTKPAGTIYINDTAGTATTNIGTTSGAGTVAIGNTSGPTTINVLGVTNINTSGGRATNIGTGGVGNTGNILIGANGYNNVGIGGPICDDMLMITGKTHTSDSLLVDAGGLTVTEGGLTVSAGGASITGATTVVGTTNINVAGAADTVIGASNKVGIFGAADTAGILKINGSQNITSNLTVGSTTKLSALANGFVKTSSSDGTLTSESSIVHADLAVDAVETDNETFLKIITMPPKAISHISRR